MKSFILSLVGLLVVLFLYGIIGTSTRVDEIKKRVPAAMSERGWDVLRYEGYALGSFCNHGGKVWYHVQNIDNHKIQYRVYVTLWGDELHFTYGAPEKLSRIDLNIDNQ